MIAQYLDLTEEFNTNSYAIFEASNYSYAVVQILGATDEIYWAATNDSGAIQDVTDGNILTSTNYQSISSTNLYNNTLTDYNAGEHLFRFDIVGRYIKLDGTNFGTQVSKLLVMLVKSKSKIGLMF